MMQIYLVGGAVRDQLLGLPIKDRDWLVVGSTAEELLSQGYQQVGKDFPVFLNPKTREEYALARTERKSGTGYTGFICDFNPNITLEQDLMRRDLTINAIAQDMAGQYHDPYNGIADLKKGILRHISPAFAEDPLRVLRVARFAARYHQLGFKIAPDTLALMKKIANAGELKQLSPERIWQETEKALHEQDPQVYFAILQKIDALKVLCPEISVFNSDSIQYRSDMTDFVHAMPILKQTTLLTEKTDYHKSAVRFAALCHDVGKALSTANIPPYSHDNKITRIAYLRNVCQRFKVPNYVQELAELTCQYHSHIHHALALHTKTILTLFNKLDVWRKPKRFEELMLVCLADSLTQTEMSYTDCPQYKFLLCLYQAALAVDVQQIISEGFQHKAIRVELDRRREIAIQIKKQQFIEQNLT